MAYIGKQPVVGNFVKLDAITTSATATYNLLNGGVAYFPQTANNCIVSLNGVIQSPTSAYTISGSTIVFSDALTSSDTIDFILVLGDVLSIGTPSDGTITSAKLASGTDGLFAWQSVQTTGFTAVAARAYPCNTTSSAFTVTLPATPSIGDQVLLLDYAGTFDTNAITLSPNGLKINGSTDNKVLNTEREAVTITYVDSTQGWVASSGVNEGTVALSPETYSIDFLVVAGGGGGGGGDHNGGGGAGGFRTSTQTVTTGTVITVTVGDGGAGSPGTGGAGNSGSTGSNSSISGSGLTTITSAGGGYGGVPGGNGGSGGGGGISGGAAGNGNTPSTSPSQGNNGGIGSYTGPNYPSGGGGGASAVGGTAPNGSSIGGAGGNGSASSITGSSVTYAGGGGGNTHNTASPGGAGGTGGGGAGGYGIGGGTLANGTAGTANTGGGGGGGGKSGGGALGGAGGKGVVILSVPTAKYSSTSTGSPTVTTSGSNTILQFNGSGTYTA